MANDRARHNILPLSKFGLMQITRQRVRPALDVHVAEKCPSCMGKGEVQPSILFYRHVARKLEYLVETIGMRDFVMYAHPFVDAYIKKGLLTSMYGKGVEFPGRRFKILPDQSPAYLQYRIVDKDRKEINIVDEKDASQSSAIKPPTRSMAMNLPMRPSRRKRRLNRSQSRRPRQNRNSPRSPRQSLSPLPSPRRSRNLRPNKK